MKYAAKYYKIVAMKNSNGTTSFKAEILAPAGNIDSFYAAIDAGADAVYFGVNDFNARAKCENFSLENVAQTIAYAHLLGVKTYITLNTLIADGEIDSFLKTVDVLYNAKADAFIVQDFGMGALIKMLYPDAVLHASTQMGIHNAEGARFLEKCGYKRVILSRESKLDDIKRIREATSLEIEFFVQGALCVAFSGNCYLSSLKDGNSGNRGRCHQLCRLRYSCGKKQGYLLSPADLNLSGEIDELLKAGVCSFKIEGRMKRPAYVAAAVKTYRLALDGAAKSEIERAAKDLSATFSRGKYDEKAYLYDNDDIIDVGHNNNTGVKIGTVLSVRPFKNLYRVTVSSQTAVSDGDGLRIVGDREVTLGMSSPAPEKNGFSFVTAREGITAGAEVFRTLDVLLEKRILEGKKLLPVTCRASLFAGKAASLTLSCGDISVTEKGAPCEKALSAPMDAEQLKKQMKFGVTPLYLQGAELETDGVFIPKSTFNELRRTAVEKLKTAVILSNEPKRAELHPTADDISRARSYYIDKLSVLPSDEYFISDEISDYAVKKGKAFIYSPRDYNLLPKIDFSVKPDEFYLDLPIIATNADVKVVNALLSYLDELCGGKVGVAANNYYGLSFVGNRNVIAGTGMNVYNKVSGGALVDLGVYDVFSGIELKTPEKFVFSLKNSALMTFTHCPYKVSVNSSCTDCKANSPLIYKDERGNAYSITRRKLAYCYFELKMADRDEYFRLLNAPKGVRRALEAVKNEKN